MIWYLLSIPKRSDRNRLVDASHCSRSITCMSHVRQNDIGEIGYEKLLQYTRNFHLRYNHRMCSVMATVGTVAEVVVPVDVVSVFHQKLRHVCDAFKTTMNI